MCSILGQVSPTAQEVPPTPACTACWDTTARLHTQFGHAFTPRVIGAVLGGCLADLSGGSLYGLPEMSERLAQYRLTDAVNNGADGTDTDWVRAGSRRCPYSAEVR
ncbi:hypothetical protein FHU29_001197 [Hoyosella altamirensis]|uniref:ADP-ribosylglycohydrolase n=1 Tax=Hoyosella altamirensis TaxID=616997 RepID=A0A839RL28_9ACTN|nr:hypothetical protein [Hoyosella altamirensis]MBB3036763.1 hypothetical protein [Hoyosella altamirensis]